MATSPGSARLAPAVTTAAVSRWPALREGSSATPSEEPTAVRWSLRTGALVAVPSPGRNGLLLTVGMMIDGAQTSGECLAETEHRTVTYHIYGPGRDSKTGIRGL